LTKKCNECGNIEKSEFEEEPFHSFYESTMIDSKKIAKKLKNIKADNWEDFIIEVKTGHDPDLALFMSYALIDLMKVPFTKGKAKLFVGFALGSLGKLFWEMRR